MERSGRRERSSQLHSGRRARVAGVSLAQICRARSEAWMPAGETGLDGATVDGEWAVGVVAFGAVALGVGVGDVELALFVVPPVEVEADASSPFQRSPTPFTAATVV